MPKLSRHVCKVSHAAFWVSLTLSGCAIGPDYQRPPTDLPEIYPNAAHIDTALPEQVKAVSSKWWTSFNDDVLNQMEEEALAENQDLIKASAAVDEAAAQARIARNGLLPSLSTSNTAQRGNTSDEVYGSTSTANAYSVGATLSWELDIWGKLRRANEAGRAGFLASRYARDAAQLSLTALVAQTYFQLRAYDASLLVSNETVKTREQSLQLQRRRFEEGYLSKLEVAQAESELASAQLSAQQQALAIQKTETALGILLGRSPRVLLDSKPRGATIEQLSLVKLDEPIDLPSNLLLRRADVASAEQQLIAANANIGVARAAYFPSISLSGNLGSQSLELSRLFSGPAAAWSFVGNVAAPIFNFGSTQAQVKIANARQQQALASYQKSIQEAFKDVYDGLNSQTSMKQQAQSARQQRDAAQEALKLVNLRYSEGYSGYFEVLDAERNAYAAQLALINIQLSQLNAQVDLYKALGGGWQAN
ncbi:efflux transporter outer membrane subunit [Hydromonas duriensis]|uniref:Multidrug efflux system outer membrane protein n=1 Tax=Hydromonas duriensis TaxID=1527608 RepID=A0A4R6Y8F9_9BURK|nr:efflux transporter outer membrane subunit [Hydromonas duriensis]TDR31668.1 multidrug efflux system outer membrane protein [Hydromonas duriensis]